MWFCPLCHVSTTAHIHRLRPWLRDRCWALLVPPEPSAYAVPPCLQAVQLPWAVVPTYAVLGTAAQPTRAGVYFLDGWMCDSCSNTRARLPTTGELGDCNHKAALRASVDLEQVAVPVAAEDVPEEEREDDGLEADLPEGPRPKNLLRPQSVPAVAQAMQARQVHSLQAWARSTICAPERRDCVCATGAWRAAVQFCFPVIIVRCTKLSTCWCCAARRRRAPSPLHA